MRLNKKFAAIALTATVALTATAAFAYWTTSGSGSGTGTAGSVGQLITTASVGSGSHPGDTPGVAVSGTVKNNSSSALLVSTVAQTGPVTFDAIAPHPSCDASWFSFSGTLTGGAQTVAPGSTINYTGNLVMAEAPTNQNACQGASVTLSVTAS